jgi:hypothetical protein
LKTLKVAISGRATFLPEIFTSEIALDHFSVKLLRNSDNKVVLDFLSTVLAIEKCPSIRKLTIAGQENYPRNYSESFGMDDLKWWGNMCESLARLESLQVLALEDLCFPILSLESLARALAKNTKLHEISVGYGHAVQDRPIKWELLCKAYELRNRCLYSSDGVVPVQLLPQILGVFQADLSSVFLLLQHFAKDLPVS